MIVACQQCGTRFTLDESLIAGNIAKVRCSRCQHVFTVEPPGGSERLEEPADREEEKPEADDLTAPGPRPEPEAAGETGEAAGVAKAVPFPDAPESPSLKAAGDRPERNRRALLLAVLSGGLLGLLLAVFALWYVGGDKRGPPVARTAPEGSESSVAPPLPPASPEELRNLVVQLTDARYQELVHSQGGQMLVIEGEVKNLTGEPRGPIRLKATLTDAVHQPVQELLFYGGLSLSDEELLQAEPEDIQGWLATPDKRRGTRVLKPGESQPFTAVLFGVPANLAEARYGFTIVVTEGPRVLVE
jgi:predicted Zn finger-like uncharacterized protein